MGEDSSPRDGGLFGLAAAFTWVMGLMGYIRSSGRLAWHVNELMADVSPWAFTPNLGFAAKMVTLNMVVFWGAVLALFWMCQRGQQPVMGEEFGRGEAPVLPRRRRKRHEQSERGGSMRRGVMSGDISRLGWCVWSFVMQGASRRRIQP